ncbi:MAG: PhzF family phenazine biosynthesis protein [Gammaproteobacteria bacterium]|jgi:trans-2,3-dihydro-3-hydroxyanthranilate isomerase|nr:PhzF family phenazine biosynthesis protein [Gammaproteobacteria bacterium]
MTRKFFITDVFSEGPYAGNQLATMPDASGISTEEMQQIARAFNFAETTFITGGSIETGFDVRIFTPNSELPFAGHPTLGTSYLIRNEILKTDVRELILNMGVGPIPVTFADDGVLWMTQNQPEFGASFDPADVAIELGLEPTDIDVRFPCRNVSTGLEFLLVPLVSYAALKNACMGQGQLAQAYFLFCAGGYNSEQRVQARMFAGELGVKEDPATGSANGCLAAYLAEYEYFGPGPIDVSVGQGYEIERPSQLYLQSEKRSDEFSIRVGGKVRVVAEGAWKV